MEAVATTYAEYFVTFEERYDDDNKMYIVVTQETGWRFSNKYTANLVALGIPENKLRKLDEMFDNGSAVYAFIDKRCKGGYRFVQY